VICVHVVSNVSNTHHSNRNSTCPCYPLYDDTTICHWVTKLSMYGVLRLKHTSTETTAQKKAF
jgi:hypothetical protein